MTSHSFSLETLIQDGSAPAVHRLSEDLFKALESIYAGKRWFSDITERDVFCSRDGRFSVTVPGNTVPWSELPDTAIYASKEYWMPVFSYLIGRVRLELRPGELPGILFNYLQTMLLILRVRLVFVDQEGYYNSPGLFDQLPIILDKLVPEYRALFTRLLTKADKTPDLADLRQIKNLFIEKVVKRPVDPAVSPAVRPVVKQTLRLVQVPPPTAVQSAVWPFKRGTDYLQNGDLVVAVVLAVALTFSVWLWSGH